MGRFASRPIAEWSPVMRRRTYQRAPEAAGVPHCFGRWARASLRELVDAAALRTRISPHRWCRPTKRVRTVSTWSGRL